MGSVVTCLSPAFPPGRHQSGGMVEDGMVYQLMSDPQHLVPQEQANSAFVWAYKRACALQNSEKRLSPPYKQQTVMSLPFNRSGAPPFLSKRPAVCMQCFKSKVKCDRRAPCGRCSRKKLDCCPQLRNRGRPRTRNEAELADEAQEQPETQHSSPTPNVLHPHPRPVQPTAVLPRQAPIAPELRTNTRWVPGTGSTPEATIWSRRKVEVPSDTCSPDTVTPDEMAASALLGLCTVVQDDMIRVEKDRISRQQQIDASISLLQTRARGSAQ